MSDQTDDPTRSIAGFAREIANFLLVDEYPSDGPKGPEDSRKKEQALRKAMIASLNRRHGVDRATEIVSASARAAYNSAMSNRTRNYLYPGSAIRKHRIEEQREKELSTIREVIPDESLWRHLKTERSYIVVGIGVVEADLSYMVAYSLMDDLSLIWLRPVDEFLDGRFSQIEGPTDG